MDQWINGHRNNGNANFKAIDSHGTVSWIRFLHQRMLLMNRTIEILCLQKRGKVKLEIQIPQQLPFPSKTALAAEIVTPKAYVPIRGVDMPSRR